MEAELVKSTITEKDKGLSDIGTYEVKGGRSVQKEPIYQFIPTDNSNVYTSLAEAYMLNGDNKRAIIYYKKSLELDPCNIKSIEMLEKLNPNRLKYGIMKDERTNINNLKSLHRGIYQPA